MVLLYRSGSLPSERCLHNVNSTWFDTTCPVPSSCSPRSDSVFAAPSYDAAHEWIDWRHGYLLDADIWAIELPDICEIYAHDVRHYENAGFARYSAGDTIAPQRTVEEYVTCYWEERVLVTELGTLPNPRMWEVLIPYETAVSAKWSLIKPIAEPDWWGKFDNLTTPEKTKLFLT